MKSFTVMNWVLEEEPPNSERAIRVTHVSHEHNYIIWEVGAGNVGGALITKIWHWGVQRALRGGFAFTNCLRL